MLSLMSNSQRWILAIVLGFSGGAISAFVDDPNIAIRQLIRHGLIGVLPSVAALKMTLQSAPDDRQELRKSAASQG